MVADTPDPIRAAEQLPLDVVHELAARLNLSRPLVILDVETTGLNVDIDRIVELGAVKIRPLPGDTTAFRSRFNPGMPISPDATAVHGITDADVKDERPFRDLAPVLFESLKDADLAGYNVKRFDAKILAAEFARAGLAWKPGRMVDCYGIWTQKERRDLAGAVKRFAPDFHGEAGGHSTVGDVLGVTAVLAGQITTYWPDAGRIDGFGRPTVADLADAGQDPDAIDEDGKVAWRNGVPTFMVGKYAGTPVGKLPSNYVEWLILRSEFPTDVKTLVADIRRGKGPVRG